MRNLIIHDASFSPGNVFWCAWDDQPRYYTIRQRRTMRFTSRLSRCYIYTGRNITCVLPVFVVRKFFYLLHFFLSNGCRFFTTLTVALVHCVYIYTAARSTNKNRYLSLSLAVYYIIYTAFRDLIATSTNGAWFRFDRYIYNSCSVHCETSRRKNVKCF